MSGGDMRASRSGPVVSISVGISVSVLEGERGSEGLEGLTRSLFLAFVFTSVSGAHCWATLDCYPSRGRSLGAGFFGGEGGAVGHRWLLAVTEGGAVDGRFDTGGGGVHAGL